MDPLGIPSPARRYCSSLPSPLRGEGGPSANEDRVRGIYLNYITGI